MPIPIDQLINSYETIDNELVDYQHEGINQETSTDPSMISVHEQLCAVRQTIEEIVYRTDIEKFTDLSQDITSQESNEKLLSSIKQAQSHFDSIFSKKNLIWWYLQQDLPSNYLMMPHKYHKSLQFILTRTIESLTKKLQTTTYPSDFMPKIGEHISEITEFLKTLLLADSEVNSLLKFIENSCVN